MWLPARRGDQKIPVDGTSCRVSPDYHRQDVLLHAQEWYIPAVSPGPVSQRYLEVPWVLLKRRGNVQGAEVRGWGGYVDGRGLGEVIE